MLARPIVHDALWRCLCPCFASTPARLTLSVRKLRPRTAPRTRHLRSLHTVSSPSSSRDLSSANFSPRTELSGRAIPPSSREEPALVHLETAELYERLRREGAAGRCANVMDIVRILVKDRRERPNAEMYASVLHSFVFPSEGTAGKVRKVLDEMRESGVELDARGCHCALEALAVHPDYLLRDEILEYMRERWFSLSDRGHNMVVAGLLRDRLLEQALEKIAEMCSKNIKVEGWLWEKTMWLLLDYGEVEEAYQTLLLRQSTGEVKWTAALWSQFLDCAAQVHHFEAVNLIWHSQVVPGYIKPATGTCLKILTLAGRRGQIKLATDVFRVLSDRDTVFDLHTYEGLMEAYLTADDLKSALSVAIIMHESGLKLSADSLGPIYYFLMQDVSRPMHAFTLLQNFEAAGRKVPVAAVNVCIQACVHPRGFLPEAIEIYKALHTICRPGANTQTFNILFQGCHRARPARKELAMFLASEMTQLGLKPDRLTYDRLIIVCVQSDDIEDAMLYYEEMRSQNFMARRGTYDLLIGLGVEKGDERTPAVLREMLEAGLTPIHQDLVRSVKERFEDASKTRDEQVQDAPTRVTEPPAQDALSGLEEGLEKPSIQEPLSGGEEKLEAPTQDDLSGVDRKVAVREEGQDEQMEAFMAGVLGRYSDVEVAEGGRKLRTNKEERRGQCNNK